MHSFRIKSRADAPTPLVRPRPAANNDFIAYGSTRDGFQAYIHRDVLNYIRSEAEKAAPDETMGLIAGRVCNDPGTGPYTLVLNAAGAHDGEIEATPGSVRITATGQASLRRRLENAHPDREVIGWYHSHPHHEAQFSHVDAGEQATWGDPNHLGIVFSGIDHNEPFGVYRGPQSIHLTPGRAQQIPPPIKVLALNEASTQNEEPLSHTKVLTPQARPRAAYGEWLASSWLPLAFAATLIYMTAGFLWMNQRIRSIQLSLDDHLKSGHPSPLASPPEKPAAPSPSSAARVPEMPPVDEALTINKPQLQPSKTLSPEVSVPAYDRAYGDETPPRRARRGQQRAEAVAPRGQKSLTRAAQKKTGSKQTTQPDNNKTPDEPKAPANKSLKPM